MTCPRCQGTGWIEYVAGVHSTPRGRVEATPEKPVYRKCPCDRTDRPTPEPERTHK